MFVLLNGAYGTGRSAAAGLLKAGLANAVVFSPERIGSKLVGVPPWLLGRKSSVDDFRDLPAWRRFIVWGALAAHVGRATVIMPMAFSDRGHLADFQEALAGRAEVKTYCLIAPHDLVRERLFARAGPKGTGVSRWQRRRARQCCEAHLEPGFGDPVDASRPVEAVAADILRRLRGG